MEEIPTDEQLIENLGFQNALPAQVDSFLKAAHSWRKTYAATNLAGKGVLDFDKPGVQSGLTSLAVTFVKLNSDREACLAIEDEWFEGSELQYPHDSQWCVSMLNSLEV